MKVDGLQGVCKLDEVAPEDGLRNARTVLAGTLLTAGIEKVVLRQRFSGRVVIGEDDEGTVAELSRSEAPSYIDQTGAIDTLPLSDRVDLALMGDVVPLVLSAIPQQAPIAVPLPSIRRKAYVPPFLPRTALYSHVFHPKVWTLLWAFVSRGTSEWKSSMRGGRLESGKQSIKK